MKLRIAFCDYDGSDDMPNAIAVTDELMEITHGGPPDWYVAEVEETSTSHVVRELFVNIPDEAIVRLFSTPTVEGEVEKREEKERER